MKIGPSMYLPIQRVLENLIAETVQMALSYTENRKKVSLEEDDVRNGFEAFAKRYKFPYGLATTVQLENGRRRHLPKIFEIDGQRYVKRRGKHDEFNDNGFRNILTLVATEIATKKARVKIGDEKKVVEVKKYRISEKAFHVLRDIAHFFIYCIVDRFKVLKPHDQVFPNLNVLQQALETMNINASFVDA